MYRHERPWGRAVSGLPFNRTPFEHEVAEMLGAAVAGAAPLPGLAGAIKARTEGAPQVVVALAAVNSIAAPAALRARVASGIGAGVAGTAALAPRPRFRLPHPPQVPVLIGLVAAAAAVLATALYVASSGDDASPATSSSPAVVATSAGGADAGGTGGGSTPGAAAGPATAPTASAPPTTTTSTTSTTSATSTTTPVNDNGTGGSGGATGPVTRRTTTTRPVRRPGTTQPRPTRPTAPTAAPTTPTVPTATNIPTTTATTPTATTTLPATTAPATTRPTTTEPATTRPPTSTTSPDKPIDAPEIHAVTPCQQRETTSSCESNITHSPVDGAVGYVVETAAAGSVPCSDESRPGVCVAVFPNGPPGCETTLHAVDGDGHWGLPSESFCVRGGGGD